jgi:hypothetical protein
VDEREHRVDVLAQRPRERRDEAREGAVRCPAGEAHLDGVLICPDPGKLLADPCLLAEHPVDTPGCSLCEAQLLQGCHQRGVAGCRHGAEQSVLCDAERERSWRPDAKRIRRVVDHDSLGPCVVPVHESIRHRLVDGDG